MGLRSTSRATAPRRGRQRKADRHRSEGGRDLPHLGARRVASGISPIVFDSGWQPVKLPNHNLVTGWSTIRFTIPARVSGVRMLGLQVMSTRSGPAD